MKKIGRLFIPLLLTLTLCAGCGGADGSGSDGESTDGGNTVVRVEVGGRFFSLRLEDNETARAFLAGLPMTLEMSDLNANEKFYDLPAPLPSAPQSVGAIRAGDVMLYGNATLVLFYKSFPTSYRYSRIGRIEDAAVLEGAVGSGSITVSFSR